MTEKSKEKEMPFLDHLEELRWRLIKSIGTVIVCAIGVSFFSEQIERRPLRDQSQDEIESRAIGELVINYLRDLDEVAYVRFASVYRNFQVKEEFLSELEELKNPRRNTQ